MEMHDGITSKRKVSRRMPIMDGLDLFFFLLLSTKWLPKLQRHKTKSRRRAVILAPQINTVCGLAQEKIHLKNP